MTTTEAVLKRHGAVDLLAPISIETPKKRQNQSAWSNEMKPAMFWTAKDSEHVQCLLCPHECVLRPGQTGQCRVRHNQNGKLVTSSFGHPVLLGVEPIEKKSFFHVFPGAQTLSLGTPGCNLSCRYCINWRVSQQGVTAGAAVLSPEDIVVRAREAGVGCLAFTYTEPTIFLEYALVIASLARQVGLAIVAKSNGYMNSGVLDVLAPWLDAINIDLKGWRQAPHQLIVGGARDPALQAMTTARRLGLWLEVTTLVIPDFNDTADELQAMAAFIVSELGPDTPWHLLRFFPSFRMQTTRMTTQHQLRQAQEIGLKAGLRYVYAKDLSRNAVQTRCPGCQATVIERHKTGLHRSDLENWRCRRCGEVIAGVGQVMGSEKTLTLGAGENPL